FKEFKWALHEINGRKITKNFGMNPQLGKYFSTVCNYCYKTLQSNEKKCPSCGSTKIVKGVSDRIKELANTNKRAQKRPPYLHQVPLEYLPTLGPKTFEKLLTHFGTEMNVIHTVPIEELEKVIPATLAAHIMQMRQGNLSIHAG